VEKSGINWSLSECTVNQNRFQNQFHMLTSLLQNKFNAFDELLCFCLSLSLTCDLLILWQIVALQSDSSDYSLPRPPTSMLNGVQAQDFEEDPNRQDEGLGMHSARSAPSAPGAVTTQFNLRRVDLDVMQNDIKRDWPNIQAELNKYPVDMLWLLGPGNQIDYLTFLEP
jgi:hypothetical protein